MQTVYRLNNTWALIKTQSFRFSQLFNGHTREHTRAHVASPPKLVVDVKEAAESLLTSSEGSLHFLFLLFTFSLTPEAPTAPSISCVICGAAGLSLHRSCSMDCILGRRWCKRHSFSPASDDRRSKKCTTGDIWRRTTQSKLRLISNRKQ